MRSRLCGPRGLRMRRPQVREAAILVIVVAALALAGSSGFASADNGGPGVAIPNGSTYDALINPGTPPTAPAWYSDLNFAETGWTSAAPAPFGNNPGDPQWCGFATPLSDFPLGSTVYLRKSFTLPSNAYGVHIVGTIDNFADVWVNGNPWNTSEPMISSGNCATGAIDFVVPNSDLNHGGDNLVAVKAQDDGSTASFVDINATYGALQFTTQPAETQKESAITPAPAVTITNADGGPVVGATVNVSLATISGSGTLTGTSTAMTDDSGVATFSNLAVTDAGEYKLIATSDGATATSNAFLIADQVAPCHGSCSATGSTSDTTFTASASSNGGSLAVSVIGDAGVPSGVCGTDFTPLGAGSFINILGSNGTITATWTLAKSLVMQAGNPGADPLQHLSRRGEPARSERWVDDRLDDEGRDAGHACGRQQPWCHPVLGAPPRLREEGNAGRAVRPPAEQESGE